MTPRVDLALITLRRGLSARMSSDRRFRELKGIMAKMSDMERMAFAGKCARLYEDFEIRRLQEGLPSGRSEDRGYRECEGGADTRSETS